MDFSSEIIETQRYLQSVLYPTERVLVGMSVDGGENGVVYSLSVPAGKPNAITAFGTTLEMALFNLIALRRKDAEKATKAQGIPPLPQVPQRPETR